MRRGEREIVGVALVGWPARAQSSDEIDTLCVLRVAVKEGVKNGCSMLYGACWRAARAMGADSMITYTHDDEPGTSLRAAGWIDGGLTSGGEWDRPSRKRGPAVDPKPKRRWWAPGSLRAPKGNSMDADERLRAVRKLLEENGCECPCDHHPDERGPDCEVCLACRIGEAVGK